MERNLREKSKHLKSNEVDLLPSHDPESSQHIGIKLKLHDCKDVYLLSLFISCSFTVTVTLGLINITDSS